MELERLTTEINLLSDTLKAQSACTLGTLYSSSEVEQLIKPITDILKEKKI